MLKIKIKYKKEAQHFDTENAVARAHGDIIQYEKFLFFFHFITSEFDHTSLPSSRHESNPVWLVQEGMWILNEVYCSFVWILASLTLLSSTSILSVTLPPCDVFTKWMK